MKLKYLLLANALLLAAFFSPAQNVAAIDPKSGCVDIVFIFARGSGESLGDSSARAWQTSIRSALKLDAGLDDAPLLSARFYELGSSKQNGYQYPAVAVSDSLEGYLNLATAAISSGRWANFGRSVEQGTGELVAYTASVAQSCPNTKFVLGGYSQGAMVISGALSKLDPEKILYVATFGDPKLYLPEGKATNALAVPKTPDACLGKNLSEYREYVPNCWTYEGVLGSYRPYQPARYSGKLGTWCNHDDIMCSAGLSLSDHTAYVSTNLYQDAATIIAKKVRTTFPDRLTAILPKHLNNEIAIILDTTGSMNSIISSVRASLQDMLTSLAPNTRVALVTFRDTRYDAGYPQLNCDFSCSLADISNQLTSVSVGGGGDAPESALSAMMFAMNELHWTAGATKSLLLVTDTTPLNPDNGYTPADVTRRSLEIDPVNLYTWTPAGMTKYYDDLAADMGGQTFRYGKDSLTDIFGYLVTRPEARLALSEYYGNIGDEFVFDASGSYSLSGNTLTYDWDLDGDGIYERTNNASIVRTTYDTPFNGFIQVRVTDQDGSSATMSAAVTVTEADIAPPAAISSVAVSASDNSAKIDFTTSGTSVLVSVEDAPVALLQTPAGTGEFTLNDLSGSTKVTLTPYSAAEKRGETKTFTIEPQKSILLAPEAPDSGSSQS